MPLKSDIYFRFQFVSEIIGVEASRNRITEQHANLVKISKQLHT